MRETKKNVGEKDRLRERKKIPLFFLRKNYCAELSMELSIESLAGEAKKASYVLARVSSSEKNSALERIKQVLLDQRDSILDANRIDMEVL